MAKAKDGKRRGKRRVRRGGSRSTTSDCSDKVKKVLDDLAKNKTLSVIRIVGRVNDDGRVELSAEDVAAAVKQKTRTKRVCFVALNAPFKTSFATAT